MERKKIEEWKEIFNKLKKIGLKDSKDVLNKDYDGRKLSDYLELHSIFLRTYRKLYHMQ